MVLRDQRGRAVGGRTPYKQPFLDLCVVTELHGNTCSLKKPDGTVLTEVHIEDMLPVPPSTRSLESEPLHFSEDDQEAVIDDLSVRRSPGQMLE